jgi:Xaa-Pro aminopeptidase
VTGLARVLDAMGREELDVLLLGREANARYVSGAARLFLAGTRAFAPGCVVVRATGAVHLLSVGDTGVPASIARDHLYPVTWNPAGLVRTIAAFPGVAAARRVGIDGLTPRFDHLFSVVLGEADFVDAEPLLRAARRVKSADEVSAIGAAVAVAERVMDAALAAVRAGLGDGDVVAVAMEAMALAGTTTAAFEPVVTRRAVAAGIDVGVLLDGYEGGFARTTLGGRPPGHEAAIAACRAGSLPPPAATHGVGLGYEVLERDRPLDAGMVVSRSRTSCATWCS